MVHFGTLHNYMHFKSASFYGSNKLTINNIVCIKLMHCSSLYVYNITSFIMAYDTLVAVLESICMFCTFNQPSKIQYYLQYVDRNHCKCITRAQTNLDCQGSNIHQLKFMNLSNFYMELVPVYKSQHIKC